MNTNRRIRDFLKHLILAKMGVGSAKDIFFTYVISLRTLAYVYFLMSICILYSKEVFKTFTKLRLRNLCVYVCLNIYIYIYDKPKDMCFIL